MLARCAAVPAVLASLLSAQTPRFAHVGDPFPDGMGQIIGAADYEADGDVDLFSTSGVFLNVNGYFVAGPRMPASFTPGTNVWAIAVADFTGDNRVDVLVARSGGTPFGLVLHVAPAAGGTSFVVTPAGFPTTTPLHKFAVLDVDQDGDSDVTAASFSTGTPGWFLFLNDGSGMFTPAPVSQWPTAATEASWIGAGDFDGDGWTDLVATSSAGGIWRRNVAGVFGPTTAINSPLIADHGAVGDFDGDGKDDAIVIAVDGQEVVYEGTSTGPLAIGAALAGILGPPPLAADLDDDGYCDLLRSVVGVSGSAAGELLVRPGGPGGLNLPFSLGPVAFAYGKPYIGLAALDVEADGDTDVAMVTGLGTPSLVLNIGTGYLRAQQAVPWGLDKLFAPPRDVDGDGDLDLLRASLAFGVITLDVARNDGRGQFSETAPAGSYGGLFGPAIWSDLDADGDDDLWAATLLTPGTARAVLNDGTGNFTGGPIVSNPGPTGALAAGDFDGNGVPDIVVGRQMTAAFPPIFHQPLLFFGSMSGGVLSYAPALPFGVAERITEIVTLDAELDGDLDLLVATGAAPRLYTNNGIGGFTTNTAFAGVVATTVEAADMNGDGLIDLVLGSQLWGNTGSGFVPGSTHAAPLGMLTAVDVDMNGIVDLVDSAGRWYPGTGGFTVGAPVTFTPNTPAAPFGIAAPKAVVADFDGDGDPDLVGPDHLQSSMFCIYSNLTRHAARSALVVQNTFWSMAIHGAPSDLWVLGASLAGTPPVPLPPLGTLFLDPASLVVFGAGLIPAGGRSDFVGPPVAPLPGLTIAWQALIGPMLSNGFDTFIP